MSKGMVQAIVDAEAVVDHLMNRFKENNLIVVHKDDLRIKELLEERKLMKIQKQLLKQAAIKPSEAVKYKLVKDKQAHGLVGWVKKNHPEALFIGESGHQEIAMFAIEERRKIQNII